MVFVVYILVSSTHGRTYIGQTRDIAKRVERHNKGLVLSTRSYAPWQLAYQEIFNTRADAMKREKWLKSGTGREFVRKLLNKRGWIQT